MLRHRAAFSEHFYFLCRRATGAGDASGAASGWLDRLADRLAALPPRVRLMLEIFILASVTPLDAARAAVGERRRPRCARLRG